MRLTPPPLRLAVFVRGRLGLPVLRARGVCVDARQHGPFSGSSARVDRPGISGTPQGLADGSRAGQGCHLFVQAMAVELLALAVSPDGLGLLVGVGVALGLVWRWR